jgi:hypothetical protein
MRDTSALDPAPGTRGQLHFQGSSAFPFNTVEAIPGAVLVRDEPDINNSQHAIVARDLHWCRT